MPFIHSIRTGVPEFVYNQIEFFEKVAPYTNKRLHKVFTRILEGSQIKKRHFSFLLEDMIRMTNEKRIEDKFVLWKNTSMDFYKKQTADILNTYGITPEAIDGICTCTTSGYITPSLDVLLQDHFGFRRDIMRLPIVGYGCSGGMASINRVKEYLQAFPEKAILVYVGETLSTQYEAGLTIANLVSNSIFADGYGTILMVGDEHPLASTSMVEVKSGGSFLFPNSDFAIGQWMMDDGLHTHIDYKLPKLLKASVMTPLQPLFDSLNITSSDINYWVLHQGGPKIMEAFGETVNVSMLDIEPSLETYRQFGNQSSVSVLTTLERRMASETEPGLGFMMAIGPGVHFEYSICQMVPNMNMSQSAVSEDLENADRIKSVMPVTSR